MDLTKIRHGLKDGVVHKNGVIDQGLGNEIISFANALADLIAGYAHAGDDLAYRINEFASMLRLVSWCHPITTTLVAASEVNRLSSMFCGPFFVSERFPWPETDGQFYEPLVQLNLEEIETFAPANFGHGLLQVWVNGFLPDDYVIRVIPTDELCEGKLTAVPDCIDADYFDEIERTGDNDFAWPAVHYKAKVPSVYVLDGKFGKNLCWVSGMEDALSRVEDMIEDADLLDQLRDFVSLFPYDNPSTEPHLFGTFSAIAYDPVGGDPTFLALEGGPCFNWNYGNAQVSYRVNEQGAIEYGFACSCQ